MTEKQLLEKAETFERWTVRLAIAGIIIGMVITAYTNINQIAEFVFK